MTDSLRDAEVQARAKAVRAQRAVNRELDAKVGNCRKMRAAKRARPNTRVVLGEAGLRRQSMLVRPFEIFGCLVQTQETPHLSQSTPFVRGGDNLYGAAVPCTAY